MTPRRPRATAVRRSLLAAAALAGLVAVPAAMAQGNQPDLNAVREATARFHDVGQAENAGYARFLDCFDDGHGDGMGQHYVNMTLLADGGAVDARHPEALVYDTSSGRTRLVAVEYVVPGAPTDRPPHLLGRDFTYLPSLGVWKLHYWIWRANPDGLFADYNPDVPACA